MADISDAEQVLVSLLTSAAYPSGTASPSIINAPLRIYRGWPVPANLDRDLAAGVVNLTVFPRNAIETNTTRFQREFQVRDAGARTITATVSGRAITLGGTVTVPQNIGIRVGGLGLADIFTYSVQANDTLTTIATALAGLVAVKYAGTTSTGPVITIPFGGALAARIGGTGKVWRELRRQRRGVQITAWCSTPAQRDACAPILDSLEQYTFITAPDGSAMRLRYNSSFTIELGEKENSYRRDWFYDVEYPTTEIQTAYEIITITENDTVNGSSTATTINI